MRTRTRPRTRQAVRRRPPLIAAALAAVLAVALLGGCGGDPEPKLTPTGARGQAGPAASQPAGAADPPVFSAEKRWVGDKGSRFTILVTLNRPSNAGLAMCSMSGGNYVGPSLVLSVRNDSATARKGPQISVEDRMVAFPHAENGCSFVFAPSDGESFDPGDGHTYRAMVMPTEQGVFGDVVLRVTVPGKKAKSGLATKELLRIPAAKVVEAYRRGPVATTPPGPTQPGHHG